MKQYLTFDDVQLVPRYSEILSRRNCSLDMPFTRNYQVQLPIIAAPMDSVCEYEMAKELANHGAVGCVHRFLTIEEQTKIAKSLWSNVSHNVICMAIGATGDYLERASALLENHVNVLIIDVAHGHHIHVKNAITELAKLKSRYSFDIVAGNIATQEAARDLYDWGADALRVGIGGGSVCETRLRTGIGVPQLAAIENVYNSGVPIPIIADGGIRNIGDIVKAIAAGASTVMLGSLLAGTEESPGQIFVSGIWPNTKTYKVYRGSASATQKLEKNGNSLHVEGASKMVEYKGNVGKIISDIRDGITSAMSYLGVDSLINLQWHAEFIQITPAGITEAKPHLL